MNHTLFLFRVVARLSVLLAVYLSMITILSAQVCSGNLGENIFSDGDFGSGVSNIVSPDPGIAPSFQYVFTGPPLDGAYTLTNNTGAWAGLWESWAAIGDNSPDPQGYMMVVNASFDPGLFYEQTIDGLCENTVYQFSADLINLIKPDAAVPHIKPNVSFMIDGEVRFSTGDIAQDLTWTTYDFTFSTTPGQTSVTLGLSNNAPGGIGNDLGLDNISFRACGPNALIFPLEQAVTCEGGAPVELIATIAGDQFTTPAIQWQQSFDGGRTWQNILGANDFNLLHTNTTMGQYYYRYHLANGLSNLESMNCRVVSSLKTVVVTAAIESQLAVQDPSCSNTEDGQIEATIITGGTEPYSYVLNQAFISEGRLISGLAAGNYSYTIQDQFGCSFSSEVSLTAPAPYSIDLGPDLSIELGDDRRIRLSDTGGETKLVNWFPVEVVECSLPCLEVKVQPLESIQLVGEATNENGCTASDSLMLNVTKLRKHFFPTAFSPNGDGVNDFFTGFGESPNVQMIEELLVFNRWGNLIFTVSDIPPNDLQSGWDGSHKGENLDEGNYIYTARIRYFDGATEQVSGEVSLVR